MSARRIDGWRVGGWVFLTLLLLFATLPMAWMLITSIKTQFAASQYPPEWWPHNPTLGNYTRLLSPTSEVGQEFLTYLLQQRLGVVGDDGTRCNHRGAGCLCVLPLSVSRAGVAILFSVGP